MKIISGLLIAMLWFGTAVTTAQSPADRAKLAYEDGVRAYNVEQWDDAIRFFRQSHSLFACPITAYWVSLSYAHLNQGKEARDFAESSVTMKRDECKPAMSRQYIESANWLIHQIDRGLKPIVVFNVHSEAGFDVMTMAVPSEGTIDIDN